MTAITDTDLLAYIRARVEANGLRRTARDTGVSLGHLAKLLNGERALGEKVASAFGFEPLPATARQWKAKGE